MELLEKKTIVVYVPYRLRKVYCEIRLLLVRELEKKLSEKDVILTAI